MNYLTTTTARIIFALPFIAFGIGHLMNANQMAGMVPLPGGAIWIYMTGLAMLLAGIAAITKYQGTVAMILLALLLLIYILTIHIPNFMNPETKMMGMMGLYKDTGLMGGALMLAGIFYREKKQLAVNS